MPEINRAKTLHQGQFTRLIKITQATSRYPERDVLVLMLGHHCGMRITEISRLTVADVMHASGKLRSEISLREAITKGCRQRCAYLASKPAIQALEAYLMYRIERGIGTLFGPGPYRALLPHQPLIYSSRGDGMSQNTKRRVLETGEQRDYKACDSLQAHVTMAVPACRHKGWFQPFRTPHVRQQGAGYHGRHGDCGPAPWARQYRLLAALRGCGPGHTGGYVCKCAIAKLI